ncbi:MAG: ATPase domain-containing protein [Methanobacteriota archaeon]
MTDKDKSDSVTGALTPDEVKRLTESERKLEGLLDKFKEREEKLLDYEKKLREREEEWERKKRSEEERWRQELLEREKEIEKREKELEMQKIFQEERELEEKERILREIENEIEVKHEKLSILKRSIGMDKTQDIKMMSKMIQQKLADFGGEEITLLVSSAQQHNEAAMALSKMLVEEDGRNGVYITFNRPFEQVVKDFNFNNIDISKVIFIDCISKMAGRFPGKKENAVFIDNPSSLEEVGMYAEKILARMPEPKFIILDSISNLLIYNDKNSMGEFIHYLINKLRASNVGGFLLTVEKEDIDEVTGILRPLVDKVIKI